MELEENIRRKDLTEAERSVKIVEMAETAKAVAQEEAATNEGEFRLQSRQNSPGRPSKPGSYRDIEERTGIDKDREEQLRGNLPRNPEENFCGNSTQKTIDQGVPIPKRGRPSGTVPGSYRDIAQRTGIPEKTIRVAEQHVAAIEAPAQAVTVAIGPSSSGKAPVLYGKCARPLPRLPGGGPLDQIAIRIDKGGMLTVIEEFHG